MDGTDQNISLPSVRSCAVLLDLTRLISRVGRGPDTGIDRVERAYLDWALESSAPLNSVVRTSAGNSILDRDATEQLRARLDGQTDWGTRDARALVGVKTPKSRSRAESDVRRLSKFMIRNGDLSGVQLSDNSIYLNVGHSNLRSDWLGLVKASGLKIASFVHDIIPLEHPEFQKPGAATQFEAKMKAVFANSDIVITNSVDTKMRLPATCPIVVAPLGVALESQGIEPKRNSRPYFVVLGTIEPRKNHALLLDIWEQHRPDADLFIVGQRGWNNDDVFRRLDTYKSGGRIIEISDMSDPDLASLLKGAKALLFPSFAEGFGLPGLEAASLGVPVICGDLAIHRETLGSYPVYADIADLYEWKNAIEQAIAEDNKGTARPMPKIPTWADHFAILDRALGQLVEHA